MRKLKFYSIFIYKDNYLIHRLFCDLHPYFKKKDTRLIMANHNKKCIRLPREICSNMNIVCDTGSSSIVLWSKNQLLIYDKADFSKSPSIVDLDFGIKKVLMHNNHLLCLDLSGQLNQNYILSRQSPQEFSRTFCVICVPDNILTCGILCKEYVVSLQYKSEKFKLFVNKFNMNFSCLNELELNFPEDCSSSTEESVIICDILETQHFKQIEHQINLEKTSSEQFLVVFSLDKINIYACVLNELNNMNGVINVIKLYKSHSKIVDIKMNSGELCILLGLSGGHIIKVPLINNKQKPDVFHLHTPLYKFNFSAVDQTVIFTDGLTMWKAEDFFSKSDFRVNQFFVKNIRDFCVLGKQIFCITFSNLLYIFFVDKDDSFIQPSDICCEVKLVTDSDCLREIIDTSHKNEEIIKKYNKETEYLTVLSLSKRQDIMDSLISVSAIIFDNYMDFPQQDADLILTDSIKYYLDSQTYYFLIKLKVLPIQHKLNKLLSDILGDLKIHINLYKDKVLKTTTIQVSEQLKNKNFLIPLKRNKIQNLSGVQIHVSLVTSIPGKLDETQKQWIVLYWKCIHINPRQFIKTRPFTNSTCLKADKESLDIIICKRAEHLHGLQYRLNNKVNYQWSFYVKLPSNYKKILSNEVNYREHLNSKKIEVLIKKNSMYKSSSNWLEFEVGDEKVILRIEDKLMKVSCPNIYIAMDIRNLFSEVIFSANKDDSEGKDVGLKLYTDIENLKREINEWQTNGQQESHQEFAALLYSFHRTIFGSLPI